VAGREGHGADVESTVEARMPTQVTPEAGKLTLDSSEIEKAKEIPIQEMENPHNSFIEKTVTVEECIADDKEARQPSQETPEAEETSVDVSKLENMKEKSVQESENLKNSISGTTAMEDEFMKEAPVQESKEPKAEKEELRENPGRSVRRVSQEGDLKELVKVRKESKDPADEDSKVRLKTREMAEGRSLYRKHMDLAKYSEQMQRIQHKSRKPRKLTKSFLEGNHFRKAPALTSEPKLGERNRCPLKKLCPQSF